MKINKYWKTDLVAVEDALSSTPTEVPSTNDPILNRPSYDQRDLG